MKQVSDPTDRSLVSGTAATRQSLDAILHPTYREFVQSTILRTASMHHKVSVHTLQFLKMYYIHQYETNQPLTKLSPDKFILNIMKLVSGPQKNARVKSEKTNALIGPIKEFYDTHYKQLTDTNESIA